MFLRSMRSAWLFAGPNGIAWLVDRGAIANRRFQSGYLTNYALIMLVGLVAAVSWVMAQ